jgi:hypothetical protein
MVTRRSAVACASAVFVPVALGIWLAYSTRWVCDDIFITFRYADQFLAGNGWVYNPGERVEGYTHFLWLMIVTVARQIGADPVATVTFVGILSFAATLLGFAWISCRLAPGGARVVVPFTALALVANRDSVIWATGGMETAFLTALLTGAFVVAFFAPWRTCARIVVSSTLLVLATMTRPDAILFVGVAGGALVVRAWLARHPFRRVAADLAVFCLPAAVVYLPYLAWKVGYYGSFLPNTYYAKSAGLTYYSQGFDYLWIYWVAHPTWVLAVYAVPAVIEAVRRRPQGTKPNAPRNLPGPEDAAAMVALAAIVGYLLLFVARVGGDFMFARFVVPTIPFGYFLFEWGVRRLGPDHVVRTRVVLLMTVLVIAVGETMLRERVVAEVRDGQTMARDHKGIIDEYTYYTRVYPLDLERRLGEQLRPYFEGLDATVLLRGQACFGYYAGFRRCIDNSGLTDREIARRPLERRGRIGHEKAPSYADLVTRNVNFVFNRDAYRERDYRFVSFHSSDDLYARAEIITYDRALMDTLAARFGERMRYIPFNRYLDYYIDSVLPHRTSEAVASDLTEFREFYFDHNEDPAREKAIAGHRTTVE